MNLNNQSLKKSILLQIPKCTLDFGAISEWFLNEHTKTRGKAAQKPPLSFQKCQNKAFL